MKTFAVYGKGGSGKSMIAANLAVAFTRLQRRALQIGCDPKHDSTRALTDGRRIPSIIGILQSARDRRVEVSDYLHRGRHGIGCIEAGGPESGVGCAGLGIVSAFRLIEDGRVFDDFDVVLMDVLGDVVCGGFATPIMRGLATAVLLVASDTPMSMYAANNIARAVHRYERNGVRLAGVVSNLVREPERRAHVEQFAARLGTRVLATIPFDATVRDAELQALPVTDLFPGGSLDQVFASLARDLLDLEPTQCPSPTPMTDEELEDMFHALPR